MGYVGAVVRVYRAALDYISEQLAAGELINDISLPQSFKHEINKIGTRGQTENFFDAPPSSKDMLYDTMRVDQPYAPVGIVRGREPLLVEVRNVLETGDQIEYLGREPEPLVCTVVSMTKEDGEALARANPGNRVVLETDPTVRQPEQYSIFRKRLK